MVTELGAGLPPKEKQESQGKSGGKREEMFVRRMLGSCASQRVYEAPAKLSSVCGVQQE